MDTINNNKSSGGIGILGVLQIVFIVLKLIGTIDWSWGLVLIPTWIGLACFVIGLIVIICCKVYINSKWK